MGCKSSKKETYSPDLSPSKVSISLRLLQYHSVKDAIYSPQENNHEQRCKLIDGIYNDLEKVAKATNKKLYFQFCCFGVGFALAEGLKQAKLYPKLEEALREYVKSLSQDQEQSLEYAQTIELFATADHEKKIEERISQCEQALKIKQDLKASDLEIYISKLNIWSLKAQQNQQLNQKFEDQETVAKDLIEAMKLISEDLSNYLYEFRELEFALAHLSEGFVKDIFAGKYGQDFVKQFDDGIKEVQVGVQKYQARKFHTARGLNLCMASPKLSEVVDEAQKVKERAK